MNKITELRLSRPLQRRTGNKFLRRPAHGELAKNPAAVADRAADKAFPRKLSADSKPLHEAKGPKQKKDA